MNFRSNKSFARRPGFTLIELLVVIAIILIAVTAILPAFGRLIESQNYASAVNAVTATLGAARTRAVRSQHEGRRTGVAFLWNAKEERMTLQIVETDGTIGSLTSQLPKDCGRQSTNVDAAVFYPAPGAAPVELPKGMGVFGLSLAVETGRCARTPLTEEPVPTWRWYAGEVVDGVDDDATNNTYLWLFPRNDPRIYTPDEEGKRVIGVDPWDTLRGQATTPTVDFDLALTAVRNAATFYVVFSPDGSIAASGSAGEDDAYLEFQDAPVDWTTPTADPYDVIYTFDPEYFGSVPSNQRSANPEVMLRAADQIAVVDLARLSDGVGIARAWLVRSQGLTGGQDPLEPAYLSAAGYFTDTRARAVSRWIDLNAEILSFNRYSGNVIRRSSQ